MLQSENGSVVEYRFDNGLGVLLKEDHTAPIVSFWTWYRVGSRNEVPGKTGISHWVEHMQFKGTPAIEKGQIFRDVSRVGGTLNALTSHDWTAYFETLPAEQLELALAIESDRMVNSLFDVQEVESERTVILSERQGAENNPAYTLYEEVNGTSFQVHPYRHMVIGYASDLHRLTRDDLYQHYRRYYNPANAYIVAAGDFDAQQLLERIGERFGAIPSDQPAPHDIGVTEPDQPGERRVLLRRPSGVPYLRVAFHAPRAGNADLMPLLVAEAVLSGGQPMGFGGGGSMGRSSRLYRALVASGIARSASSDMGLTLDPYLFQIGVTGLSGVDLERVEAVIDEELSTLRDSPIPEPELARAKRQIEAQLVYSAEGASNQAFWLGQWEIVDSWKRANSFLDQIRAVNADDIQRVAQTYLVPQRRTVGWLVPEESSGTDSLADADMTASVAPMAWGLRGPVAELVNSPHGFQRGLLRNGVPVLGQERPQSRSIALRVRIAAGSIWEQESEAGVAHLTARSTLRGSDGHSFEEINNRTDELGSSIAVDASRQFVEAWVRCLNEDLPEMIALLAQTLLAPDFPQHEVDTVKADQIGAIAEADNDTRSTADRLLRRTVYPAPNPLGRRVLGSKESVTNLDLGAIRGFHARTFVPAGASVAVVGNLNGFDRALDLIDQSFGAWNSSVRDRRAPDTSVQIDQVTHVEEEIAGKSQADLVAGMPTISRLDDDYYALDVANLILGRLGLMGRLGAEVRDRQGLAYYAYSQIEPRADGSLWTARAGVDPGNVDLALTALERELVRLRNELVSEEEIRDGKSYLIGVLPLALESHDGVASMLLAIEEFQLGLDYLQRYPSYIEAITRDDVLEAARRYLDPIRLAVAVAKPA